jgi:P-type Ca2+ transporter type 2B
MRETLEDVNISNYISFDSDASFGENTKPLPQIPPFKESVKE